MDILNEYILGRPCHKYIEQELIQILNTKVIITSEHIQNITIDDYNNSMISVDIIQLFEKYGFVFTEQDYKNLLNKNGRFIYFISDDKKTEDLCKIAVQQVGYLLKFIPEDKKTDEICKIAVQQDGPVLVYVPENKKTDEICKIAVQQDQTGYTLQFVPKNKKIDEICRIAEQKKEYILRLNNIKSQLNKICKYILSLYQKIKKMIYYNFLECCI